MRSPHRPATGLLAGIAALCLVAVLAALLTQHLWGMMPCPWCVLQRLVFLLVGAAALLGVLWQSRTGQRVASAGVLLTALAGAAAALWQHFVAASSASCNLTLADRIMASTGLDERFPQVFAAYASCADAKVKLLGLPYEYWSFALFALIAGTAGWLLARRLR